MKRFYFPLFAILSVSAVVVAMAFVNAKNDQPDKHLEIVLRNIGHQLLLHSKDSTSRVMPVEAVNKNTFRISFENSFGFTPDTLRNLVHQQLAKTDRPGDYMVSVNECSRNQTVFAYEINSSNGNLTPCNGRVQKKGCYVIEITFLAGTSFNYAWLLLALVPLALVGLYLFRRKKSSETPAKALHAEIVNDTAPANQPLNKETLSADNVSLTESGTKQKIGNFLFDSSTGILSLNGEPVDLSEKETKAINIFAVNQNLVVERNLLMKEIWEDEGVIVITRNVDVLISKLRRKLSADPSVKIVNVHGKGYKLVTNC